MSSRTTPRLGIALGSGAARGWAHIGVLRALEEVGIVPHVVAGASIGALVGAAYANQRLDALEEWVLQMDWWSILRYLDVRLTGVNGERLMQALSEQIGDVPIESLTKPFGAVATDLATGREVWFQSGSLLAAVRASIALPGLFTPVRYQERWLADGGLVDPLPVSLCRALGADWVIAVNLNGDIVGKHFKPRTQPALLAADSPKTAGPPPATATAAAETTATAVEAEAEAAEAAAEAATAAEAEAEAEVEPWLTRLSTGLQTMLGISGELGTASSPEAPGWFDAMASAINIMQDRITRTRLAGDPPDVVLAPRLAHLGLMEFDQAEAAIAIGQECVRLYLPLLRDVLRLPPDNA